MKTRYFFFISLFFLFGSCSRNLKVTHSSSEAIRIDSTLNAIQDTSYIAHLVPIKEATDSVMDQVLGVAPEALVRRAPESNLMNWSADALREIAVKETGMAIDAAVVNLGGLRCDIPQGNVTMRSIFSLMPFDNELVVVTMEGKDILDLCNTFAHRGGEGISGIRMTINGEKAEDVTINGKPVVPEAVYYVATSDYLSTGTDEMVAFTRAIDKKLLNKKIRDLYIDYVREKGVMEAHVDGRTSVKTE
ncbi:MAG: 5'-nucleotidase C-terminal domain-containing protein [Paludibacteraceae bacterium]|nr:5'-nucleotidase C-terminal domain-containing protein [Paludibacteraceae bacterium]